MKHASLALLLFSGCSAATVATAIKLAPQVIEVVRECRKIFDDGKAAEVACALVPATPTAAPVVSIEPTPEPKKLVAYAGKCVQKNPQDGVKRGFLWKPDGENLPGAVVVLPSKMEAASVEIGTLKARYKGLHTDRQVWIFDGRPGKSFAAPAVIARTEAGCFEWKIVKPAVRTD
jgi:hypothetical protein